MAWYEIDGGVTAPRGFRAAGTACGIKSSGKPDVALIVSDVPCTAAGAFTRNMVKAAPSMSPRIIWPTGGSRASSPTAATPTRSPRRGGRTPRG